MDPEQNSPEEVNSQPSDAIEKPPPNRTNKFVRSSLSIHDRTQLEVAFSYGIREATGNWPARGPSARYSVEAFIFLPPQMAVRPSTYSRSQFYADLRAFIRLREPKMSFKKLMGKGKRSEISPLVYLEEYLTNAIEGHQVEPLSFALDEAKIFGCSFVSFYLRRLKRRIKEMTTSASKVKTLDPVVFEEEMQKHIRGGLRFLEKSFSVLRQYRRLIEQSRQLPADFLEPLKEELLLIDEYVSYGYRDGLLMLLQVLQERSDLLRETAQQTLERKLRAFIRLERWYAAKHQYGWVEYSSTVNEREEYVYRKSSLKKRAWSVLYLNPRPEAFFELQKQLAPMIAAAFAAGWALLTTVFIWQYAEFRGFGVREAVWSAGFLFIASAFVASYVLKDRIKEIGRVVFARGLLLEKPDLTNQIFYENSQGREVPIGVVREYMDFASLAKVEPEVRKMRSQVAHDLLDPEAVNESVIHYRKRIALLPEALQSLRQPVQAVQDIIRLNIEGFLQKLDNPYHEDLIVTKSGTVHKMLMPKVYQIDIVLKRTSYLRRSNESSAPIYEAFKIILDKTGLIRVEEVG